MRAASRTMTDRYGSMRLRLAQTTALGGALGRALGGALAAVLAVTPAYAQTLPSPGDGVVTDGAATITNPTANTLRIAVGPAAPRTVIDWNAFDIGVNQTAEFRDTTASTTPLAVLNRVVGVLDVVSGIRTVTPSTIMGNLLSDSNISVYVLNPQGVLFTSGAVGTNANVSVGSLIVSSLNVSNADFMVAAGMRFAGSGSGPITVDGGTTLSATAASARGIIALIGAKVDTRGTLNATGEVALVAADTATINLNGSPISVTIAEGTRFTDPILAYGSINGSSVLMAAATHDTVTAALLDVQATITATTAFATDRGIVLAAGPTSTSATGVAIPGGIGLGANGAVSLNLTGALTATGVGGAIDLRARSGITATTPPAAVSAAQSLFVRADLGGIVMGDVAGSSVDLSAGGGAIALGGLTATDTDAAIVASAGAISLGSLLATGSAVVTGTAITMGTGTATTGALGLSTVAGGDIAATMLTAETGIVILAGGNLVLDSANARGVAADLGIVANAVGGPGGGATLLTAGRDLVVTASDAVTLATATAGHDLSVTGTILTATGLAATTGALQATATGGIVLGAGSAGTTATINASAAADLGTVDATHIAITAGGTVIAGRLSATQALTAALEVTAGAFAIDRAETGGDAILSATGLAQLGNATAARDLIVSGGTVRLGSGATALQSAGRTASYTATTGTIATVAGTSGLVIRADAAPIAVGTAGTGAILLDATTGIALGGVGLVTGDPAGTAGTANTGDLGIGLATAGSPLTLGSIGARTLRGLTTATPFAVDGTVTLGATRLVNGLAISTPGAVSLAGVTVSGAGQSLSIASTGAATAVTSTGTLSALSGVTAGAVGDVLLTTVTGGAGTTTITSTGASVSAGSISGGLVNAVARTALALGSVSASDALSLTSDTGGIAVAQDTAAVGPILITAPGVIKVRDVISTGGTVAFGSAIPPTGAITARAVRAFGALSATRAPGLSFTSVTSDTGSVALAAPGGILTVSGAVNAHTSASLLGATVALGSVTSGTTTALNAAGVITVAGDILAADDIAINAAGLIQVRDVRSSGGAVAFGSVTPPTGAITARAVRAFGALSATRAPGLTFASATSDTAAVTLAAPGGGIVVTGATGAGTSVDVSGSILAFGAVTAVDGHVDLAATDTLRTGAITARDYVEADSENAVALASASSETATVGILAGVGTVSVVGPIVGADRIDIAADGLVSLGAVTSTGSLVDIESRFGALTVGSVLSDASARVRGATDLAAAGVRAALGDVSLTAATGTLGVAGNVHAGGAITAIGHRDATLGSFTALGAGASLVSATTGRLIVQGASDTVGAIIAQGQTGAHLGSVASSLGAVTLASGDGFVRAGIVSAASDATITARTGVTLAGLITGTGFGSIRPVAGEVTVTGVVSTDGLFEAVTPGAILLAAVTSRGGAVLLEGGPTISADAVTAHAGLTVRALGSIALGSAASDLAAIAIDAGGALEVIGDTAAQTSVTATTGGAQMLGDVTTRSGAVSLTATGGSIAAGAINANLAAVVSGATGVTLKSVRSVAAAVTLDASAGALTVVGATRSRGPVILTARDAITVRNVTSDLNLVTITSGSAGVGAATIVAMGAVDVVGATGVTLATATSTGGSVTLRSSGGGVIASGAIHAATDALVEAAGAVALDAILTDTGAVTLRSADAGIAVASIDAATSLAVIGEQDLSLGTITARGIGTGGSALLTSRSGGIAVGTATIATALDADAAALLSVVTADVGGTATLSGHDVAVGTIRAASLSAVARGGDLSLGEGDIGGAAALTKTGATGAITVGRLAAGGPTRIGSAGAVRADLLQGGAATITAAGAVSGRSGGLSATTAALTVDAGDAATIAGVTTTGTARVTAGGAALLSGALDIGGDLVIRSATVTLGDAGLAVSQSAVGLVQVTSTTGGITGLSGLVLRSDATGVGGRDIGLDSAAGILFAPGTLVAGGVDRQSALRLAALGPITFDVLEARTIASPGATISLNQATTLTIARAATRDTLAITLAGAGTPALSIGAVEVRAGDLSLDAAGALSTGMITVGAGTTTLAGASIASGAILTRGLTATARATDAIFSTIDATAGGIAARAAGDVRVTRGTASGEVALVSASGNVTAGALIGSGVAVRADAIDGSHGKVTLTTVSGAGGIDLVGRTIVAETLTALAGGVTASTRRDAAGMLDQAMTIGSIDAGAAIGLSSGNGIAAGSAPIALDRATSTGGSIAIATIAGGLGARTGSGGTILSAANGPIALDIDGAAVLGAVNARTAAIAAGSLDIASIVATDGGLSLATRRGPLVLGSGRSSGAATIDAAGAITLDTLDAASVSLTGTATATLGAIRTSVGDLRVTVAGALAATTLAATQDIIVDAADVRIVSAAARDLWVVARTGGLRLDAGRATRLATLTAPTMAIGTLDAGSVEMTAATDVLADRVTTAAGARVTAGRDVALAVIAAGGDVMLTGARALEVGSVITPAAVTLSGLRVAVTALNAGTLDATAGTEGLALGIAHVVNLARLVSGGAAMIGTLDASTIGARVSAGLTADRLAASAGLDIVAGSAALIATRVAGGGARLRTGSGGLILTDAVVAGDLAATTDGLLSAGRIDVAGGVAASGAAVSIATLLATGDAALTATTGDLLLGSASVGGALAARAGGTATIIAARVGGTVGVVADTIAVGAIATPALLSLTGRRIDARLLEAGALAVTAGTAGATLETMTVARDATLLSGGGLAVGALVSDTARLSAVGAITVDGLTIARGLVADAAAVTITRTDVRAGDARMTARTGGIQLGTAAVSGTVALTAAEAIGADTLAAGGATTLTAATAITVARLGATSLTASGGTIGLGQSTIGRDATLDGGSVTLGSAVIGGTATITARGRAAASNLDIGGRLVATAGTLAIGTAAVRGGDAILTADTITLGTLTDSGSAQLTARQTIVADRVQAGVGIVAQAAAAAIGAAIAAGGDVAVTATGGDIRLGAGSASGAVLLTSSGATAVTGAVSAGTTYRIDAAAIALGSIGTAARQAGGEVALTARTGTIAAQGATTLAGVRAVTLAARGTGGGIAFAPDTAIASATADVTLATTGVASLGTVTTSAGAIRLDATDAALTRAVTAQSVVLNNVAAAGITRIGDLAVGNEAEFGASATRFDLSTAELALIGAPSVTIASGARDVVVGAVGLATATGATRFAITATGRIDMLGRFVASGSPATRTIAIGNMVDAARTGVIRIAATQAAGGRLAVGDAALELTADRIGAGLDRGFLDPIGYRTGPELAVDLVSRLYVARPESALYNAVAQGGTPYTDAVILQAGTLRVNYGRYALFQNTGAPGLETGVILGSAVASGGVRLQLATPGSASNAFALYGTIDGIGSQATALLGASRVLLVSGVSPTTSRLNGCIIGSGAGCLGNSIAQPSPYLFDTSRAEIVRTADDLTLPFDPLIGTNNEALYLDSDVITVPPSTGASAGASASNCEGKTPCPPSR